MPRSRTALCTMVCFVACLLLGPAAVAAARHPAPPPAGDSDWPTYGGDPGGTRFSPHTQITRANVASLQPAWQFHTGAFTRPSPASNQRANFEATPVLWHGALFFDTPFDAVFAVDAETGRQLWTFDPGVNREAGIYIVSSRGVALWHGTGPASAPCGQHRVFVATLDRRLIARDAATGAACPDFGANGTVDLTAGLHLTPTQRDLYGFTSPPTVVGDVVIVGSSIGDNQAVNVAPGVVRGFDARTGRQLWSWDPLPWAHGNSPVTGGGNAWSILSADPQNDLVFVPTGSPAVDFYGGLRPGDDRDADSLVALRASTGQKVWAFQFVHHDLWDYDTPSEPLLFTFRNSIPAVAVVTKTSMVFVFNRLSGEPLYPIVERPVPQSDLPGEHSWPTQPFSSLPSLTPLSFGPQDLRFTSKEDQEACRAKVGALINKGIFTPPSLQSTLMYPGSLGGANWGSPGLDPATGILYVHVNSLAYSLRQNTRFHSLLRRLAARLPPSVAAYFIPPASSIRTPDGGEVTEQRGTPYELYRTPLTTAHGIPCAPRPYGSLVALDLNTGTRVWSTPQGSLIPGENTGVLGVGGPAVTASGLVFAGATLESTIRAFDAATGQVLWQAPLPGGAHATPMTYMVKGRQFVVIAAGGSGMLGSQQNDTLVAFALPTPTGKSKHAK